MKDRDICALLSYLLVGLIWYAFDEKMHKDAFVKYHVKQGLVLLIFAILWGILLSIVLPIFFFLFFLIWIVGLLQFVPLLLAILGIINVANGKKAPLPVIGKYSKKFTF